MCRTSCRLTSVSLLHPFPCSTLRSSCRTSDPEVVTPPAQSPKSTAASTSSRQPFANRALPADPEPEPDAEDNNNNPEDDESGDISTHVARAGVVSGKMYRKSVLVSTMPKAPNAPPQKEGYLMKKSPAMLVGWQKRFFVTNSNGDLEYYKSVRIHVGNRCACTVIRFPVEVKVRMANARFMLVVVLDGAA